MLKSVPIKNTQKLRKEIPDRKSINSPSHNTGQVGYPQGYCTGLLFCNHICCRLKKLLKNILKSTTKGVNNSQKQKYVNQHNESAPDISKVDVHVPSLGGQKYGVNQIPTEP
jgi:hypothetical protein